MCIVVQDILIVSADLLNVRNLFHEIDKPAFIAKQWSVGISRGKPMSLRNSCLECFVIALTSSCKSTSVAIRASLIVWILLRTVFGLASCVGTLLPATGTRLIGCKI